ncbi:MAG: ABC transporter permease [Chitinophagia bacterium]|nr:ABC transporter permease [Chitinophagia bacterium]
MHFLFAWRYFRGKYAFQAIQMIAWVSVLAIAIGTAALITVLSVSNGFTEVVKGLYSDFYADIRVTHPNAKFYKVSQDQMQQIQKMKGVLAVSKVVENRALLVRGEKQAVVMIKGVDTNYTSINQVVHYIKRGAFILGNQDQPHIVMGIGVEQKLGLFTEALGDTMQLFAISRSGKKLSSLDQLNSLSVTQTGAFSIQQEFDEQYLFTNFSFAQYLLDIAPSEVSAIELSIQPGDEKQVVENLTKILGNQVQIQNKYQQNSDLYKIMQMEKWIIFFILAVIMIVASFNLVGALTMLVLEKKKDIHVLHAMGASSWDVQKIFLLLSGLMAFIGAFIGGTLASVFCALQMRFHFIKLQGNSFVIDYYPIKPMWEDYLAIIGLVVFIALLAGWIPAKKAAKQLHEKI